MRVSVAIVFGLVETMTLWLGDRGCSDTALCLRQSQGMRQPKMKGYRLWSYLYRFI